MIRQLTMGQNETGNPHQSQISYGNDNVQEKDLERYIELSNPGQVMTVETITTQSNSIISKHFNKLLKGAVIYQI
jgi:hypothetical protein